MKFDVTPFKASALSHPDVPFVKYWGKKTGKENIRLPSNGSISFVLDALTTTTTVEFSDSFGKDIVNIQNKFVDSKSKDRVLEHVARVRALAAKKNSPKTDGVESTFSLPRYVKVYSTSNFPMDAGISSSGSGFSALTVAAAAAAQLRLSKKELSILARQGSGSACRPIMDGFVEWIDGDTSDTSYAKSLHAPEYWDVCDVIAIISYESKSVSTSDGMELASTSPFFATRIKSMRSKIAMVKKYIREKNFAKLGEISEHEALEMHAIALTSHPPIVYWLPETIALMHAVQEWRKDGLQAYFTLNTGQNVHILVEGKNAQKVAARLNKISVVKDIIVCKPSNGAHEIQTHLF